MALAYSYGGLAMRAQSLSLPLPRSDGVRPSRHGGWAPRVLAGIVALAIALLLIAPIELNRPWVKRRVQDFVRSSSGLDVDYGWIQLHVLSGIEVDDVVVHSPPELRAFAPDLVRVGRVDARWSMSSLFGRGAPLEQIVLTDVALAVVVDEHGRTSLDAFETGPSMAVPLSYRPLQLLASSPPAARIDVARADLELVWTQAGRVVERDRARGLGVAATAEPGRVGWRVRATSGSADTPLDLQVTRERAGSPAGAGRAKLSFAADMTASALSAAFDLNVLEQSFVPSIEAGDWHAEASARFEPATGLTTIAFDRLTAPSGAATAEASLEVPDEGDPIVRHAQGDVDVAHLLAWLPAGVAPVAAERAVLHFRVDSAVLGLPPRLSEGGRVLVTADVSNAKVRMSAGVVDVHDLAVDLDGQPAADGALTGRLDVRFGGLQEEEGNTTVVARDGRCTLRLERILSSGPEALRTRSEVAVSAYVASLDARLPAGRVSADAVKLEGRGRIEGHAPYGGEIDASASGLQVFAGAHRLVARAPAHVEVAVRDVFLDGDHPLASRGVVRASIDYDQSRASFDAVKGADAVAYTLRAAARNLKAFRPFLPPAFADAAAWDTMAIALRSTGRVERITGGDPQVEQDTSLDVDRPAFAGVSARSLSLALHSRGTLSHHEAVATLRLSALAIAGAPASDDTAVLSATLDRGPRTVRLEAGLQGRASAQVAMSASFEPETRAVVYDVDGRLSGLGPIAPLLVRVPALAGLDLSRLELGLASRGALLGVVSSVSSDGAVELEPDPLSTAAIEGTADVHVAKLGWARGDAALEVPVAAWHGDMRSNGARRTLDSHVEIASMRLGLGRHEVDVAGFSDDATVTMTGDLRRPSIDLTQRMAIRAVQQNLVAEYPVGDLTLALSARRDPDGLVGVSGVNVRNGSGGTTLAMGGGVDLSGGRRRLSMTADVAQDLKPLSAFPERFAGTGEVEVAATLESPDMSLLRTRLVVKIAGVHARLPGLGVAADSVDGEIPVTVELDVDHAGVAIRRGVRLSPFARLRFADQHPLLHRGGFLSIGRLTTPLVSIAPFVGNLAIEQNLVSLRQFEMGVRGGWLTGECALDWDGPDSTLEAHLRASGVQSSHGEPFDGNAAVVVTARDRMIEGRAEVVRMGRRHLLDLLDMEDPLHVDRATNGIRSALDWGYPERMSVVFDNGFASAHIELGGLAQLMSVGDLHGVPTGPFVDRLVEAVLDGKAAP